MKTKTKCAATVLLILVAAACSGSPQARRDKHLSRGKELIAKREYSRAILEFRNAAKAMPGDAEIYYQTGIAAAAAADIRTAFLSFRKAAELNPGHSGAQLRLAQLLAHGDENQVKDAGERLTKLLANTSEVNPEMLNTLALTELKLGNAGEAIAALERSLSQAPGELASAVLLSRTRLWQKDLKGAEDVLKKACEQAPQSADARRILGEFYGTQARWAEAEAELRKALAMNPDSLLTISDLARLEFALGRKQDAEKSFKKLSGFEGHKSVYAKFLFQEGRREEALREFERVTAQNPEDRQARTERVAAYLAADKSADAVRVLETAITKNSKDGEALLQRAEILIRTGKLADAENDLNEVRRLKPAAAEVHYVASKLHHTRGNFLQYRQELSETLRLNPLLESVRVELARDLVNRNEARAALDLLNAAPEMQKSSPAILLQKNWANWALGDLGEMRKGIDRALAQRRSVDFLIQDAALKIKAREMDAARKVLAEAVAMDPADVRPLQYLSQSYEGTSDAAAGLRLIKEHAAKQPRSAAVQHLLGTVLMRSKDYAGARTAFAAAKAADPKFVQADFSLAQLDVMDRKLDGARARVSSVMAANPDNIAARQWLANMQVLEGKGTASIDTFRKIVLADPNNAEALNNLAYLLAEQGASLDEALKYAEKAVELAPDQPEYCDTLGWVLYRKGIYPSAIKYLERAEKGVAVAKFHLAMAYAKAGDSKRSKRTLEAALRLNPDRPEAKIAREVVEQTFGR